jgi:hypothetical protein
VTDVGIRKPKRGRTIFASRPEPAYESRPPDDESIRDAQSRPHPWGEKAPPKEDEGEADSQ